MCKMDWANLEIVEEWAEIDPGDPKAISRKKEQMQQLARLVLEIYFSVKKSKHRKNSSQSKFDNQEVDFIGNNVEAQPLSPSSNNQKEVA